MESVSVRTPSESPHACQGCSAAYITKAIYGRDD